MSGRRAVSGRLLAVALAACALASAPAAAHIQVRPFAAAPGDPVLWTVLVPSEDEAGTRQVELAVPADVLPFSFEDAPGWTRTLRENANGSLRSIVWRGRTRGDGLATFRFLASTPEREGALSWKAIQTYRDGAIIRWIGSPASDHPASTTRISRAVARENAGGEGSEGGAPTPRTATAATAATTSPAGGETGDGTDWLARALGLAALLAAAVGALASRHRSTP